MTIKYLEISLLEKLPTKRLLAYYKKIYPTIMRYQDSFYCKCCGTPLFELNSRNYTEAENVQRKIDHRADIDKSDYYLATIKDLLAKREHVEKK
jgi:hypothetical protein